MFCWEIISHIPYSSDLALCDFHLFPALKKHLSGKSFDNEIKGEVKPDSDSQTCFFITLVFKN